MNKYYVYEDNVNEEIYYHGEKWESVRTGRLVEFDTMEQVLKYIQVGKRDYEREKKCREKYKEENRMTKEEILNKYGNTMIEVKPRVGDDSRGVKSIDTGEVLNITVNRAMENWTGTHWLAKNEFVVVQFNEDYGHRIRLIGE